MIDQIKETISAFGEDVSKKVATPAARHLMCVDNDAEKLSTEKAEKFHSVVAKLLFVEKRARPDIETAVAFLCTRVSEPDVDDWKKLKRLISYLNATIEDTRIIGCDNIEEIFTWVDAAYAVHPNMRSHTGGTTSMGWGVMHSKSSKQRLNTKSSTEAEIVGVSEYAPHNIWLMNFMSQLGYKMKKNILYQDNESAIRMETNGRTSCTGNSRHISIRYFFVKDRVDKGELSISYCPTHEMLADFFTKPLQGALFKKFRDVIMGWEHIDTLKKHTSMPTIKERVGNSTKEHIIVDKNVSKDEKSKYLTYAQVAARGMRNSMKNIPLTKISF